MRTIEELLCLSQAELYGYVKNMAVSYGFEVQHQDGDYIIVNVDDTPKAMLCVHLDTINTYKSLINKEDLECKDGVIKLHENSLARCLGGDDRAGVWIALKLMEDMYKGLLPKNRFSFGFFCDEEVGGVGSTAYTNSIGFKDNHLCFIGLDRRNRAQGQPELALYGWDNPELISKFSLYKEVFGSFTDCSVLAQASGLACVNLSVGYRFEHTPDEYLDTKDMEFTYAYLTKVIITEKYLADTPKWYVDDYNYNQTPYDTVCCDFCGNHDKLYNYYNDGMGGLQVCEKCLMDIVEEEENLYLKGDYYAVS